MTRSLKVAPEHIERVKSSLQRNVFPSQKAFATELGLSESTVKNFLSGKGIDRLNFIEICEKLGLDWQAIGIINSTNELNREDCPFITGLPIIHPRQFFGRKEELKRLFNLLKRHPLQNGAIIGQQRIGKTSLLHYLKNITTTNPKELRDQQKRDWLINGTSYQWVFIDFQDSRLRTQQGLLKYILKKLGIKDDRECNLESFMEIMSQEIRTPTVILMDEIGKALKGHSELNDDFWESLRSLGTNGTEGNLGFVLASHEDPRELAKSSGHSSPFFNIFGCAVFLQEFNEEETRELIASSPILFPEDDIKWIIDISQGVPYLVQILCRERFDSLEAGDTGESWREEGLKQIHPFRYLLIPKAQ